MKKLAATLAVFLLFVIGLWYVAIPQALLVNLLENSLPSQNLRLKAEGLEKGLFYNLRAERIVLTNGASTFQFLYLDNIKAGISLRSLFKLDPALAFDCYLNNGKVSGTASFRDNSITVSGSNINIQGIPFFELLGVRGNGHMTGHLWHSKGKGSMEFTIQNLRLESSSIGTAFLPLELFHEMRGALTLSGKTIEVQSFTLQGKGISARLKGKADGNYLDMNLEVMLDSSYTPSLILQEMLKTYKVSPGYFILPVKTYIAL